MTAQVPTGLDLSAFTLWAARNLPAIGRPTEVWLISGGRSNLTFGVRDDDGRTWCLRRPPLGPVLPSAHDVLREFRILSALQGSDVPVPATVGACADESVIGAPFYVMSFVPGRVVAAAEDAGVLPERVRMRAGPAAIEAMQAIHRVDVAAVGLEDLGRPDGYVARQLRRWRRQVGDDGSAAYPLLAAVADRLESSIPPQQTTGIVHGDLKLGNLILTEDGDVAAVLDWELCTLGDPLADLGWLLASWSTSGDTSVRIVAPPSRAGGFATGDELVAAYAAGSPLDLSDVRYYAALADWKWAAIDVGIHKRFSTGQMGDAQVDLDTVVGEINSRLEHAWALLTEPDGAR
jgi:aminoglycoside phosphotransferase (APT) family kinase protein